MTSFAPEIIISTTASKPAWHLPWIRTAHWDYVSYTLHTLGDVDIGAASAAECVLLSGMMHTFTRLVHVVGENAWGMVKHLNLNIFEEFVDESSPRVRRSFEVLDQINSVLVASRVEYGVVSLFGMLQWFSALLTFQRRREMRRLGSALRPCRPFERNSAVNTSNSGRSSSLWRHMLEQLMTCLIHRQLFNKGQPSKPLSWILTLGLHYWGPLHIAMAEAAGREPYLLPFPRIAPPPPPADRNLQRLRLVELCVTAKQQRQLRSFAAGGVMQLSMETRLVLASQRDGARLAVVTVATGLPISIDSEMHLSDQPNLMDFLVYAEKPRGECLHRGRCWDKNRTVYTCGPHAAMLPEVSMRKWWCLFPTSKKRRVDAYAVSFFRQAATIRCPLPSDVSLSLESPLIVELQADPPYAGAEAWRIAVDVCLKPGSADDELGAASHAAGIAARLGICIQPAWDMMDLERSVPHLIRTFLRYYQLLGADSFTFYDLDGSFASHPEVVALLATGKLKYFPRFMKAVSELLHDAWNSDMLVGSTGSKGGFMQELTLNHCVLNMRGSADFVLIGAMDVFLAFGPSTPAFPRMLEGCGNHFNLLLWHRPKYNRQNPFSRQDLMLGGLADIFEMLPGVHARSSHAQSLARVCEESLTGLLAGCRHHFSWRL